jgi:peroxiredoxin
LLAEATAPAAGPAADPAVPTATSALVINFDPTDPEIVFGDRGNAVSLFQDPDTLLSVAALADLPGNIATGNLAPDFDALTLEGESFNLAAERGSTLLIVPTAMGCAECVANLRGIAETYPDFRGRGLNVLVLDLVSDDDPEIWRRFADYIGEPEITWSVATSPQFAIDYDINTLGTVLLVDPEGYIVFRSEYPLSSDGFRQLLDLATSPILAAPLPSPTSPPPTPEPTATPEAASFSAVPGNKASGEPAIDFAIEDINGDLFNLSDKRGKYVLLLPTVPGCGECNYHLILLDLVFPDYREQGILVLLLDLYPEDNPGFWEFLANQYREPDYIWGTAASGTFVLDYEITTLGTVIFVDPNGDIVYRSEDTVTEDIFQELFDLATSS